MKTLSPLLTLLVGGSALLVVSGVLPCPLATANNGGPAVPPAQTAAVASAAPLPVATVVSVEKSSTKNAAPALSWATGDGQTRSLAGLRGKVVLVNFWATWCPPCREEIPALVNLRSSLAAKGFEVVGISVGENAPASGTVQEHVARFAQRLGISYPLVLGSQEVADAFGDISALPTSFIIGRDGRILERIVGGRDEASFRRSLERALGANDTGASVPQSHGTSGDTDAVASVQHIGIDEFETMRSSITTPYLLDVREPIELTTKGQIPGVVNIPLGQISARRSELPADRETPIYAICQTGNRSKKAASELVQLGYQNVYSLDGGTGEWIRRQK